MPAASLDAVDDAIEHRHVGGATEMLDEIEAHPAHTGAIERVEIAVGEIVVDNGNAAIALRVGRDAVEHRGIVGTVAACLHDYGAFDPQMRVQRCKHFFWRIGRRVAAVRRIGEFRRRTEHVTMRVAASWRQFETRFAAAAEKSGLNVHGGPLAKQDALHNHFVIPGRPEGPDPESRYMY